MGHIAPQQGMNWRDYMGNIICIIGYKVRFGFPSPDRYMVTRLRSVGWICHVWIFQARQNKEAMEELKRQIYAAEKILSKRQIGCIEDLNIGDLSAFMEISVPMECMVGFHWEDYPNLNKLHQVNISQPQTLCMFEQHWERPTSCQLCCEVPGFYKVHQPFLDFCRLDKTDFIWRLFEPRKVSFVTEGGLGASIVWQNHKIKSHSSREYRHHRDAGTQPSWWTTMVQVILLICRCFCALIPSQINPGLHLCQNSAQDCKSGVWVDFGIDRSQEADPMKISE